MSRAREATSTAASMLQGRSRRYTVTMASASARESPRPVVYEPARRRDAVRLAAGADAVVVAHGVGTCDTNAAAAQSA
jgi:hypothetical protein